MDPGGWLIGQQIVPCRQASQPEKRPGSSMNYIEFTGEGDLLKSESPKIHNSANCKTCKPKCSMGTSTVPEIYPERSHPF